MKQLWTSLGLLCAMVVLLTLNGARIDRITAPVLDLLPRAETAAAAGDWSRAEALTGEAFQLWRQGTGYLRVVRSHSELEEITLLLAETEAAAAGRDRSACRAACVRAAGLLRAMSSSERLSWGNLL